MDRDNEIVVPISTLMRRLTNVDTITDYDQTVREVLKVVGGLPPSAFNEADAVVAAILTAVDSDNPPLRLATGSQAVNDMRAALTARLAELEQWAPISNAVDSGARR